MNCPSCQSEKIKKTDIYITANKIIGAGSVNGNLLRPLKRKTFVTDRKN